MAACPQCGRTLATGAKKCVYCAQGTSVQRRQELKIPRDAMAKRKKGLPWGWIILVVVVLVAVALYYRPEFHDRINNFVKTLWGPSPE
ncbi:MAG TPA: hypothetical protein VF950_28350 [Planctomycetota bacterium]